MIGYIDERGKYRKRKSKKSTFDLSSQHRSWHQEKERRQFGLERVQPRKNGKPNPEFVRGYPDIAAEYFTKEQIKRAEREL